MTTTLPPLNLNLNQNPLATSYGAPVTTGSFSVGRGSKAGDIPGPELVNSAGMTFDDNGVVVLAATALAAAMLFSVLRKK